VGSNGNIEQLRPAGVSDFLVPADHSPERLDAFVVRSLSGSSRRHVRELIGRGAVRVNSRIRPKGTLVRAGDVVRIDESSHVAPTAVAANPNLPVSVLYEDDDVIVVDKPAGLPAHTLRGDETGTIVNFLVARYPELQNIGRDKREPGLVHRLDTDTSGVLLAARTKTAYDALRRQFSEQTVVKEYVALAMGDVPEDGEIRGPIAHDRRHRRRMRVCASAQEAMARHARTALTRYRVLRRFADATLLSVEIPTGVMHQIRAHLASVGHPIVGDKLYGGKGNMRQLLHAHRISFTQPRSGDRIQVESPWPPDLLAQLEKRRRGEPRRSRTPRTGSPRG
jgi:23S rRNA pseudouridine1911/1915/1917 synthase